MVGFLGIVTLLSRALALNRVVGDNYTATYLAAEGIAVEDEFAAAAASALTTTLGPWFAGERELNYEGFVDVLEWASSGFGKQPSSGGT